MCARTHTHTDSAIASTQPISRQAFPNFKKNVFALCVTSLFPWKYIKDNIRQFMNCIVGVVFTLLTFFSNSNATVKFNCFLCNRKQWPHEITPKNFHKVIKTQARYKKAGQMWNTWLPPQDSPPRTNQTDFGWKTLQPILHNKNGPVPLLGSAFFSLIPLANLDTNYNQAPPSH